MIPARCAPVLSGFLLSGLMSLVVSGIAAWRMAGTEPGLAALWAGAWLRSWPVAFPLVLVAAPLVRRWVQALVVDAPAGR